MINNNIIKDYDIVHLENILSTLKCRRDEIEETINSKYTAEYKKSKSDGFVGLYYELSKLYSELSKCLKQFKQVECIIYYHYKAEHEKYKFLIREQLSEINRFVYDTFKCIQDGYNVAIYKNICDNPKISLCFDYGDIFIVKDTRIISKTDIQHCNNKDYLKDFLKTQLNDIQRQFIQNIQNAFANMKSILQDPNILKPSFNFSPFKFYKDVYKKKIKDQERQKQNDFYSNYAKIIKQNRIKPFYKNRGYLDYKDLLNKKVKDLRTIKQTTRQK